MSVGTDTISILCVDDDPEFADLTATYLERYDERFTVTTATNPQNGLDHLRRVEIDCIVSDYDMPEQNGIEFLENVREDYPDLPFILFTGQGSEEVASDAISIGATDYLQKGGGTDQYELLANRARNAVDQFRATREARTTQRRLQELAESTTDCLWMFDRDWDELLFISGYEDVWDRPTEAIEENPQDFLDGVDPDYREFVKRAIDRLSDGESIDIEYKIRRSDGEPGWVWVKGEPVFGDGGNVVRVVGFTRDITERTVHERERELERYETIVEALADPVYALDADGHYTFVNDAFTEQVGYSHEEVIGEHASNILREEDIERGRGIIRDLLSDEDSRTATWEMTRITADGERIPIENHLALLPLGEDGEFRGTAGVVRDITERKRRERELEQQNERLEQFTGVVAHDLRNPLSVVEGRVELAHEDYDSEHLDAIESAAHRMSQIIDNLLRLAREGQDVGSMETIGIQDVVDDAWNIVADSAGRAAFTYADEDIAATTIEADPDRLSQLFENLLRNALEHGGEDVTITVGTVADGVYLEDDGPGIPENDRERIFDVGYSTHKSGTGFGLGIANQIVAAHGWEIHATDGSEGGARFEITGIDVQ